MVQDEFYQFAVCYKKVFQWGDSLPNPRFPSNIFPNELFPNHRFPQRVFFPKSNDSQKYKN